jgi:hypothetical protein
MSASDSDSVELTEEEIAKRRVPCIMTYMSPFRIVERDRSGVWNPTIKQINEGDWDYVALHEIVGGIDVGLESPYHLIITRDGSLALPPIKEFMTDQYAAEYFNKCLAGLLIGGIYCECVNTDSIERGVIIDWTYVRSVTAGLAASNRFHKQIRYCNCGPLEAINLLHPKLVFINELNDAMQIGMDVLNRIPRMRADYLLRGVTGIGRRDWGSALANLWIVVEQLIASLWEKYVISPTIDVDNSKSRRDQLSDTRTWTAAARIEMLYQKSVIDLQTLRHLSIARKSRNNLHHEGIHPSIEDAYGSYRAVCDLMRIVLEGREVPLFDLKIEDHSLSDPFAPPKRIDVEPRFWMEIPKLPGEQELEKAEAKLMRKA